MSHPEPANVHIVPTVRDPGDGLALSSRNARLAPEERQVAGTLYAALKAGEGAWKGGCTKAESLERALEVVSASKRAIVAQDMRVDLRLDYVEMNDSATFEVVGDGSRRDEDGEPVILSGAMWLGQTRLIDNIILGHLL
jgi:pantoate--beta-alanine ligase